MSILRAYVVKIFNDVFHVYNPELHNLTSSTYNATNDCDSDHVGDGTISNEAYISAIIIGIVRLIA